MKVYKFSHQQTFIHIRISSNMDLILNTLIFIDLYLTLVDPFQKRRNRKKWYVFTIACFIVGNYLALNIWWDPKFTVTPTVLEIPLLIFQITLSLIAAVMFSFVIGRLCLRGTSQQLRKRIIYRHIAYFSFYSYQQFVNTFVIFNGLGAVEKRYQVNTWVGLVQWEVVLGFLYYVCGLMLAVVRFREPYVWTKFTNSFKKLCCKKKRNKEHLFANESLCSFINSAMNIEFVYLILIGINNHMEDLGKNYGDHKQLLE